MRGWLASEKLCTASDLASALKKVLRIFAGADSRSGASGAILLLAEVGLFRLVVSRQVLDEAEGNLRKKLPRALATFAELLASIQMEIVPDPETSTWQRWEGLIEEKDAPILEAAVVAGVDRLLTLNTRDFTPEVTAASGLHIQTPAQFITDLRDVISDRL